MTFLVIVISSVLVAACATSGAKVQTSTLAEDREMADRFMQTAQAFVQSAVGGDGNVRVLMTGDRATLVGYVESIVTKRKAEQAALRDTRVKSVFNRIVVN